MPAPRGSGHRGLRRISGRAARGKARGSRLRDADAARPWASDESTPLWPYRISPVVANHDASNVVTLWRGSDEPAHRGEDPLHRRGRASRGQGSNQLEEPGLSVLLSLLVLGLHD